jgi:hypothetical protein
VTDADAEDDLRPDFAVDVRRFVGGRLVWQAPEEEARQEADQDRRAAEAAQRQRERTDPMTPFLEHLAAVPSGELWLLALSLLSEAARDHENGLARRLEQARERLAPFLEPAEPPARRARKGAA